MRRIFTVGFLFALSVVRGQDITGVWHGHFQSGSLEKRPNMSMFDDRYKFEVQIVQDDKTFEAITYSYLSSVFYCKADARGTLNPKTGKVLLQEGKVLELRMTTGDFLCTMTCFLKYTKLGDVEFLEGTYGSMNIKDSSNCGRGTIMLRKVATSDFYKEPFLVKKEEENLKKEEEKRDSAVAKTGPVVHRKVTPGVTAAKPGGTKPVAATGKTPGATVTNKTPGVTAGTGKTPGVGAAKPGGAVAGKTPGVAAGTGKTPGAVAANTKPPGGNRGRNPATSRITGPSLARIGHGGDSLPGNRIDTDRSMPKEVGPLITPEVLRSRSNELVRTIVVNTNEVVLNIYDDGAIDNDTISVYLDKKQVISHAMLTDRAIVLTIPLDGTNNYHELVMVAENEGTIPPNTSLMIVKAGDKRYEVRITSTEQKNAVVIFKYDKNEK